MDAVMGMVGVVGVVGVVSVVGVVVGKIYYFQTIKKQRSKGRGKEKKRKRNIFQTHPSKYM